MLIHCPKCNTEYNCEPGKYECECGAKFSLSEEGLLSLNESFSSDTAVGEQPIDLDIDKTIPPRQYYEGDADLDKTMPGKGERKTDGRFGTGDLILSRYKVLTELGQGGMGVVYKCFDEIAGIEIALKALPPELSHNTTEMEDVKENFQLVSRLVHQNIAISKNLEKDNATGNYYLIMECVEGEDLRHWIKRKRKDGDLTIDAILPLIRQVAAALDYAHEQKIIHRDIKPGNIMIDQAGHVKVLDFGLAAQIHTSMTRVSMAYHGTSGTAPYMAPEQWRGRAQGAPADQYALAVMTYEMLAGHLPFESTDASVLREAVLNEMMEPIPGIPEYAQQALTRGMSKEPTDRFSSCLSFANALGGETVHLHPSYVSQVDGVADKIKLPPWFMNKKTLGALMGAIFFLFIIIIFMLGNKSGSEDEISRQVSFSNDGKTLLKAPASIVRYKIPKGVTTIGKEAFRDCKSLTSITIPNSVIQIEKQAFQDCQSLTNLTIPNSVKKIETGAFNGCESLKSITIPNGITDISWVFTSCTSLTSVVIPNSVTSIGYRAFSCCSSLRNITIPDSVKEIGAEAFENCEGITGIKLPNGITTIGSRAFSGTNIKNLTIPNGVSELKDFVFADFESLTSVRIPNSVKTIGNYAFSGCKSLKSIEIPNSVTSIRRGAFADCTSLANITIPDSVGGIWEEAFRNCRSLKNIQIPNKRVLIWDSAFKGAGCEEQVVRDYSDRFYSKNK